MAIRTCGLRKRYGSRYAVDGIDLAVAPGEVFALLGPNGAGKTTTVEILAGYRRRDGGEVSVLGADPAHAGRAWRARIGVVLQQASDPVTCRSSSRCATSPATTRARATLRPGRVRRG